MAKGTGVRVVTQRLSDSSEVFNVEVTFPQGTTVVFEMDSEKSALDFEYAFAKFLDDFEESKKIVGIGLKVN